MTDETITGADAPAAAADDTTKTVPSPEGSPGAQAGAAPEGDAGDKPKVDPRTKRINELTFHRRQAERERDFWREEALRAKQTGQPATPPAKTEPTEPKLEDFEYDQGKYTAALVRWNSEQERIQAEKTQATEKEAETAKVRMQAFIEREGAFAEQSPDYRGIHEIGSDPTFMVTADARVSEAIQGAIFESENAPALLHYLDTHRDESTAIAKMSPYAAAAALGRIEARLNTTPAAPAAPSVSGTPPAAPPKPVTKAPPPPPAVKPTASPTKGLSDEMPVKDWLREREKQLAAKAKAGG
jgi:hypothetical protein